MSSEVFEYHCPALKRIIEFDYCQELQFACDDAITWNGMEDQPFDDEQCKTCRKCIKRIDPSK